DVPFGTVLGLVRTHERVSALGHTLGQHADGDGQLVVRGVDGGQGRRVVTGRIVRTELAEQNAVTVELEPVVLLSFGRDVVLRGDLVAAVVRQGGNAVPDRNPGRDRRDDAQEGVDD